MASSDTEALAAVPHPADPAIVERRDGVSRSAEPDGVGAAEVSGAAAGSSRDAVAKAVEVEDALPGGVVGAGGVVAPAADLGVAVRSGEGVRARGVRDAPDGTDHGQEARPRRIDPVEEPRRDSPAEEPRRDGSAADLPRIVPAEEPRQGVAAVQGKARGRRWRGFTGSVAAGLAVLAVGVLGVGVACLANGAPGPGVPLLVGHPVAAVAALLLQRVADRRNGRVAGFAGAAVLVVAAVALTVLWLL
ncbi:hypothetical protein [Amycolatopsis jiangsuensis]|uniref:Uncharacterized protein n=1 Tax=Amycolatopsis jiangsuensis TaxID=1181879 RepID=A0A840IX28_9PSEU|nr:hypothetical protein [Amycolatopsis jiangsuensis]MBB4686059.1 hypothetical protein [Amycolatopsis jiangsuensis]